MYRYAIAIDLHRARIAAFFAGLIALSLFCYAVFLLLAVERTAGRAKDETSIQSVSAQLGTLESQYLARTQTLTPQLAANLGYVAPSDKEIVYVQPQSGLSLQTLR